jgi:hypothetical protein
MQRAPTIALKSLHHLFVRVLAGLAAGAAAVACNLDGAQAAEPRTPVISGDPPASVIAGGTYAFQPKTTDPGGKRLAFSVKNKPSWANFSIASGRLDGTPSSEQLGIYDGITISVSDGTTTARLAPFSINVTEGKAELSWVVPTRNVNGTPLTDLAGVILYYGKSKSYLGQEVVAWGRSVTRYTITGLTSGTWYFAARAYTTDGAVSAMSAIVSKTIR